MLKDSNLLGGWGLLSAPGPLTIASYNLPEVRGNQIRYGWRDGRWIVFLCRCLQNFLYLGIYRLMLLTLAGKIQEPHLGSRLAPLCTYNEYLLWTIVRVCSTWSQWPPQIVCIFTTSWGSSQTADRFVTPVGMLHKRAVGPIKQCRLHSMISSCPGVWVACLCASIYGGWRLWLNQPLTVFVNSASFCSIAKALKMFSKKQVCRQPIAETL